MGAFRHRPGSLVPWLHGSPFLALRVGRRQTMNFLVLLLAAALAYLVYTMLQSYRSLERELREIRLKCMGTRESAVASADPAVALRDRLLSGLNRAVQATQA